MINQKSRFSSFNLLTDREREIMTLIINEYTTREIATTLFLSTETIKSHRASIMRKLDVKNVAGIVREAIIKNLVNIPLQYVA